MSVHKMHGANFTMNILIMYYFCTTPLCRQGPLTVAVVSLLLQALELA